MPDLFNYTRWRNEVVYGFRHILRENYLCRRIVEKLQTHEHLSLEALDELQRQLLYRTLILTTRKIGFYKNIEADFSEKTAVDALRSLFPLVTKQDLVRNRHLYYPNQGKEWPWTIVGRTSGTTGSPLNLFRSPASVIWAHSFKLRHWTWSGYRWGMPIATLRGDLAVPIDQDIPPFWFFNRFNNQLIISSRHLRPSYILKIIEKLEEFTPFLMEAYPSTAYELALYLEQNERYLHIPYIYTGSELLHKHQREMIEQRFKARVMDHYGMAERIAYATECLAGNLHINTDYSYVEIVDDDGNSTDGYGYLVGTTFHNLSMPLIRYKMSDQTKWKKGLCACGKPYPMIEAVTGKLEDVIWGGDGSVVSPSVITFAFKGMTGIRQSQVAQVGNREWEIRIVPMGDFTEWHKQKLVENVRDLVDSSVNVKIKIVPEIARTAAGKYKWVVNEFRNSDINTTT